MAIRRTYNWYVNQGLTPPAHLRPKITGYERKTYRWYVEHGMVPPANLKPPKTVSVGMAVAPANVTMLHNEQPSLIVETQEQVEARIRSRFEVLEILTQDVIEQDVRALIVSGPAGLGKSFTIEQALRGSEVNYRIVKGHIRATGLYKLLYEFRNEGDILVFDDADSVFADDVGLNLLKAACDTSDERVMNWLSEREILDSEGEEVPSTFTYEGSIIFITNYDFDRLIATGSKLAPHLNALVSRAHYIDLMLKTVNDYMTRINQVIRETDMLGKLTREQVQMVVQFLDENKSSIRELSLRTALKVADHVKSKRSNWQQIAKITCCKV